MTNFIIMYTPSVGTYSSPEFNLTIYVDSSYKEFLKIPADRFSRSKVPYRPERKTN